MTPPEGLDVCMDTAQPVRRPWWPGWRQWLASGAPLTDAQTWPRLAHLEAGLREILTMPNLLDHDPVQEISLYVDRDQRIHVHHPQAQTQEAMILVANVLLKASQVVAAQAGAQVVSHPPRPPESP